MRNLGDRASGLVMVDLPAGVTFAEIPKWCEQDPADPTSITCDNPYIQVVPCRDQWIMMDFEVVVAAGVDAPVICRAGGQGGPVATAKPAARSNSASGELPDGVRLLAEADLPGRARPTSRLRRRLRRRVTQANRWRSTRSTTATPSSRWCSRGTAAVAVAAAGMPVSCRSRCPGPDDRRSRCAGAPRRWADVRGGASSQAGPGGSGRREAGGLDRPVRGLCAGRSR